MKKSTSLLATCILLSPVTFSQPGTLDSTFGGDGTVKTNIAIGGAFAFSAVLQADEKIVLEGHTLLKDKLIIARLKTDGSLDSSFGLNGAAVYDSLRYNESHNALALQTDGKIVLATNRGSVDFAVIRFLQNGTLDSSFGSNGRAAIKLEGDNTSSAVAIQPDGKIVVAGSAIVNNYWHGFALARYNANGTIDSSFGSNGISRELTGDCDGFGKAVAIQPDGKIVLAGYTSCVSNPHPVILRYNSHGHLDSSFSGTGKIVANLDYALGYAVAIQKDGKIVVGGDINIYGNEGLLLRYLQNGELDSSFGTNGETHSLIGNNYNNRFESFALQVNGAIVVLATSADGFRPHDFGLIRFLPGGQVDLSFGTNGTVLTDIQNAKTMLPRSVQSGKTGKSLRWEDL